MSCKNYRRLLIQSLRGGLSAEERALLSDHLGRCTACRKEHEEFEIVYAVTGFEDGIALPPMEKLLSHTMRSIMEEGAGTDAEVPRIRRWLVPLGAAAVIFLLLALGLHWARPDPAARSTDGKPRERIALVQPDFELPDISLREIAMASFAGEESVVRWEDDFEAARSLAAYSCCPILYQVYDEGCPIADWIDSECMKNKEIVNATRNYICIRRNSKNHALKIPPKVTPAFFIICPDGEVHQEFGGMVTRATILAELSKYTAGDHWINFRKFSEYREMLEEAADAYHRKAFGQAQEKLCCFSDCCSGCEMKKAGIFEEYRRILAAMQTYITARHAYARDLVNNEEIDRARNFYSQLIDEFRGLPIVATLRAELAAFYQ